MARPAVFAIALLFPAVAAAQPAALPAEQLKKVKAATAFVRVDTSKPDGGGSGSGFLVKADGFTGWVVTNDHVVTPSPEDGRRTGLTLVWNSGTPAEWSAEATVVGRDPGRDLAVLKFTSKKALPAPLALAGPEAVAETTAVYVCGFPFGDMMAAGAKKNPEISIGPASVSSVRSDEAGKVVMIQLNGALNPGNSGGPVVTTDGKLVGVAVMTLRGAGIGLAIPHGAVAEALAGRLAAPEAVAGRAGEPVQITAAVMDPFGMIVPGKLWLAPAAAETPVPPDVAKLTGAVSLKSSAVPGEAAVSALVPFPKPGPFAWVQAEWKTADGEVRKSTAAYVRVMALKPVAKVPDARTVPRFRPPVPFGPTVPQADPLQTPQYRVGESADIALKFLPGVSQYTFPLNGRPYTFFELQLRGGAVSRDGPVRFRVPPDLMADYGRGRQQFPADSPVTVTFTRLQAAPPLHAVTYGVRRIVVRNPQQSEIVWFGESALRWSEANPNEFDAVRPTDAAGLKLVKSVAVTGTEVAVPVAVVRLADTADGTFSLTAAGDADRPEHVFSVRVDAALVPGLRAELQKRTSGGPATARLSLSLDPAGNAPQKWKLKDLEFDSDATFTPEWKLTSGGAKAKPQVPLPPPPPAAVNAKVPAPVDGKPVVKEMVPEPVKVPVAVDAPVVHPAAAVEDTPTWLFVVFGLGILGVLGGGALIVGLLVFRASSGKSKPKPRRSRDWDDDDE